MSKESSRKADQTSPPLQRIDRHDTTRHDVSLVRSKHWKSEPSFAGSHSLHIWQPRKADDARPTLQGCNPSAEATGDPLARLERVVRKMAVRQKKLFVKMVGKKKRLQQYYSYSSCGAIVGRYTSWVLAGCAK